MSRLNIKSYYKSESIPIEEIEYDWYTNKKKRKYKREMYFNGNGIEYQLEICISFRWKRIVVFKWEEKYYISTEDKKSKVTLMSYFKLVGSPMGRKVYNPVEYRIYTNGRIERYAVVYIPLIVV